MLNLLEILNRNSTDMYQKCLNIGELSLIARSGCGKVSFAKQTKTTTRSLACLSYTKSSPISKRISHLSKRAMNAAAGSSIRSWRSWCRLLHRKRPIYFDVLKHFLELAASGKNDSTPSWHHPRFLGNGFGKGFGR